MSGARTASLLLTALAVVAFAGCAGDDGPRATTDSPIIEDPGPVHVHGLGINPADGALFVATHTGLFRAAPDEKKARRVAARYQDTMGFTITGPDRFLGSGHPDRREKLPPFLGLIESADAGRSWKPRSLQGKADFHVLEAAGRWVYGFGTDWDSRRQQLLVSRDGGTRWLDREAPEPLVDLAIDPTDPRRTIAAGADGLYLSGDGGRRWRSLPGGPGLLAWPQGSRLYLVSGDGAVERSRGPRGPWQRAGEIGGQPAAFATYGDQLYVALHDGTIKRSDDDGQSWSVRSKP